MIRFFRQNLFLPVLLISSILVFYGINKPFIGHHDWNSAWFATIARNHLRYGLLTTKLGQTLNVGEGYRRDELGFHTHHPPLLPLGVALSFFLFGESELAGRLVPAFASLFLIFLIYRVGKLLADEQTGALAALLATVTPIFIYFSKIIVHETVVPAFILFAFYHYICWTKDNKRFHFFFFLLGQCWLS